MKGKIATAIVLSMSLLVLTSCIKQTESGNEVIEKAGQVKDLVDIKTDDFELDIETGN